MDESGGTEMTHDLGGSVRVLSSVAASDFPDEWYELAAEGHFWLEWRFRAFSTQLAALGVPVDAAWHGLDVGCGHGMVRRQIERATAWTTDGADLNVGALEQNQTRGGEAFVYDIHDRRPELAGRYDFVVLFDVIEHLPEPGPFIDSALHHLRPGGWLFVNVPALAGMHSTYDDAVGHLRRYDRRTLGAELAPHALDIRDVRYWGLCMLPYLLIRKLNTLRGQDVAKVIERGILPPKPWMNAWILRIMRLETRWLRNPPLGTSLLAAAVKR
jgi:SAM-dependent methyltransferase